MSRRPSLLVLLGSVALLLTVATTSRAADGPSASPDPALHTSPAATDGPDPSLAGQAFGRLTRTWSWTLERADEAARIEVASGSAMVRSRLIVRHGPATETDVALEGSFVLANPGGTSLDVVEASVSLPGDQRCGDADDASFTVGAGRSVERRFHCDGVSPDASMVSVEVTWAASEGRPAGTARLRVPVEWQVTRVDACVDLADQRDPSVARRWCVGEQSAPVTAALELRGEAATCVHREDRATIVAADSGVVTDAVGSFEICTGADPEVAVTADASSRREWRWSIDKSVDHDRIEVAPGASAEVASTIVVDARPVDVERAVAGTISVHNPSDWQALRVSVAGGLDGSGCEVAGGEDLVVGPAASEVVPYRCVGGTEAAANQETVVTVLGGRVPSGWVVVRTPVATAVPSVETDRCATLIDPRYEPADLGPICVADGLPRTITYRAELPAAAGRCTDVPNTATLAAQDTGTAVSDTAQVTVCGLAAPAIDVSTEPAFLREHRWRLDKAVEHIETRPAGSTATVHWSVTATQIGSVDRSWSLRGRVAIANPTHWAPVAVTVDATVDDGGVCAVDGGPTLVVEPGAAVDRVVRCRYADAPDARDGRLTVTVTPADARLLPVIVGAAHAWTRPTVVVGDRITVTDTFEGTTWTLGHLVAEPAPALTVKTDRYSRVVRLPAAGCTTHTNVARIEELDVVARRTVRLCAPGG